MAENDSTSSNQNQDIERFTFTSTPGLYQLRNDVSAMDLIDQVGTRLSQLTAMLMMTYGEGGEAFRSLNDDHQDNYLWGCFDLATESKQLFDRISAKHVEVRHG